MKKTYSLVIVVILISFAIGAYFYPQMPGKMASHWNTKGEVDGYISKFWGLFLMPFVSLGMFLLFLLIPMIDPMKENVKKFRKYFDVFIFIIMVFFLYIYLLTIFWNLGFRFDMGKFIVPAMGILFYYCGVLTENAKRNWFIGIRTPWTLSNEKIWEKTHKIGGKLFKFTGIVAFLGILFSDYAFYFIIIPVFFVTIFLIVYSYLAYQKETKQIK